MKLFPDKILSFSREVLSHLLTFYFVMVSFVAPTALSRKWNSMIVAAATHFVLKTPNLSFKSTPVINSKNVTVNSPVINSTAVQILENGLITN